MHFNAQGLQHSHSLTKCLLSCCCHSSTVIWCVGKCLFKAHIWWNRVSKCLCFMLVNVHLVFCFKQLSLVDVLLHLFGLSGCSRAPIFIFRIPNLTYVSSKKTLDASHQTVLVIGKRQQRQLPWPLQRPRQRAKTPAQEVTYLLHQQRQRSGQKRTGSQTGWQFCTLKEVWLCVCFICLIDCLYHTFSHRYEHQWFLLLCVILFLCSRA